jgi:hypothetical protein
MEYREYLLSYGNAGEFGRFRAAGSLRCRRGDRAVVRSPHGLQVGVVLCEATPGHAHFLPNTTVGHLVRLASGDDERTAAELRTRGQEIFTRGRQLAAELGLPLEILDVEVLLDARQALVYYLGRGECDPRPLMDPLADRYRMLVSLHNLALPVEPMEEEDAHGSCGSGACGSGAGCGSCGSGGCGSCGIRSMRTAKDRFASDRPPFAAAGRGVAEVSDRPPSSRDPQDRVPLL